MTDDVTQPQAEGNDEPGASEAPAPAVVSTEEPDDDLLSRVPIADRDDASGPGTTTPGSQVDEDGTGGAVEVPGGGIDPPLGAT
jgi:hypothetical protein